MSKEVVVVGGGHNGLGRGLPGPGRAGADRCIELLGRVTPDLPGAVLHRQLVSPPDLERDFDLHRGSIFHGAMTPPQRFSLRPALAGPATARPCAGYTCARRPPTPAAG